MKAKRQDFNLKKFIVRAAWVTLILAAIEIPLIYMYAIKKNKPSESTTITNTDTQTKPPIIVESKKDTVPEVPNEVVKEELPKTIITADTVHIVEPAAEVKKPVAKPLVEKKIDTIKPKVIKVEPKRLEAPIEKELSEEKMTEVMNDLNAERIRLNKTTRCIKIRKTTTSNVSNAFKIVDFLKAKGFVISGREETSKSQRGVTIDATGDCFTITIGSL
jgi:hypothetical protein